jgi:4a-hydroxytetrahydrobiopterin dehydratase
MSDQTDIPATVESPATIEKIAKSGKSPKAESPGQFARSEKAAKPHRAAKSEKQANPVKAAKSEKAPQPEKSAKPEKASKPDKRAKAKKTSKPERPSKTEKTSKAKKAEKPQKASMPGKASKSQTFRENQKTAKTAASPLHEGHCKPLKGTEHRLDAREVEVLLKQLPDWESIDKGDAIQKTFTFKNYYRTLAFVNALAFIAHNEDHHPDLGVHYGKVVVRYSTHDVGGLSMNDFICAAKVQSLPT